VRGAEWARPGWVRQVAFALAMVAQLFGLGLSISEGRAGVGAGTHIEAVGTTAHYSHDESTCGACHLRTLHGGVSLPPRLASIHEPLRDVVAADATLPSLGAPHSSNRCRAPPIAI